MESNQEGFEDEGSPIPQSDLIKSYISFAVRAIRRWQLLVGLIFVLGVALTWLVVAVWPRSYHCEMKLLSTLNKVLASDGSDNNPLIGAAEVIGRHENLRTIVVQSNLVKDWELGRSPALKLKDRLTSLLRGGGGQMSEEDVTNILVPTLAGRLSVQTWENTLTIGADWSDGQVAARIVEAAHQVFMESRHQAEVSALQEKISILEGHAHKLREEADRFSEQLQRVREERLAQAGRVVEQSRGDAPDASAKTSVAAAPRPRARAAEPDEELPALKEELESKKKELSELEADRKRRLIEAQAKLTELAPKYTPAHPLVRAAQQNVELLSQEPPRIGALRAEVQSLESAIKVRTAAVRAEGGGSGGGVAAAGSASRSDLGSAEILRLVDNAMGLDPGASAQLQGTLAKYGALRDAIGTARIDLDEAQAAFNYRYKVIIPPEAPNKPIKPKVPVMLGIGVLVAIVIGLLVPVLLELRSGVLVGRWQIYHLQLPIVAELTYPPGAPARGSSEPPT